METDFNKHLPLYCLAVVACLLGACGTPPAKDYGGKWKPVNRFQATTSAIPLNQTYAYYASPMDETLCTMLRRWAKDAGLKLSYELPSDYTLYQAVAQIHTTDLHAAASQLSSIYAAQGVAVSTDGHEIRVSIARASSGEASANTPQNGISPAQAR